MNHVKQIFLGLSAAVLCSVVLSSTAYAGLAGRVQFVSGNVQIVNASGSGRNIQKGDAVNEGDSLVSAAGASAQIKMQDGGMVALRPDTHLKFDQFVFNGKQDGSEKSFFSLLRGGFRAITGLVGQTNKQNYRINTPVATVGIRGTDHETVLILPNTPMALLAPSGAYSKVNVGETTLTTNLGTINVTPNQMGFAGALNQAPQVQAINTKLFTVVAAPVAKAKVEKTDSSAKASGDAQGASETKESAPAKSQGTTEQTKSASTESAPAAAAEAPAPEVRAVAVVDTVAPNAAVMVSSNANANISESPKSVVAPVALPIAPRVTEIILQTADGNKLNINTGDVTNSAGVVVASINTPTLSQCIATPTTIGCSDVLPLFASCLSNPATAGCSVVLPSLTLCTSTPTTNGCAVVLPTLTACTNSPTMAGCTAVLPSLASCLASPSIAGCTAVIPSLATCTSSPTTAGCSSVLPTLSACIATPTAAGCSAVLPSLALCTSTPATNGCSVVLPTLTACTNSPTTAGCTAVLPSLASCLASPSIAGCTAVIPSLATCTSSPTTAGCSSVLPTLSACIAIPTAAGCSAVLPSLALCTSTPATNGCSVVLPTLTACTSSPTTAGCSAVLPSLAACTSSPSTAGCSAVLPTLSVCTGSPTTMGCSAVLPSLATCISSSSTAGCSAVLPSLALCTSTPATNGCSAVLPTLTACISTPSAAGCSAVLPSLAVCTSTPATNGCTVVLPTFSSCMSSPTTAGCSVVLPSVASCSTAPTTAGCSVVLPIQAYVQTEVAYETSTGKSYNSNAKRGVGVAANVNPLATTPSFQFDQSCTNCTSASIQLPGASGAVNGQATSFVSTGIEFGRWTSTPSISTNGTASTFNGQFHWIKGPASDPFYLPEVLLGSLSYTLDGGTAPTNQSGVVGSLNSASLVVNFTRQTADLTLGVTANGHTWVVSGTGNPLNWLANAKTGFSASTGNALASGLTVTMDGTVTGTGYVSGQLTGNGLNGAMLQYELDVSQWLPTVPGSFVASDGVVVQAPSVTVTNATTGGVNVSFPAGVSGTVVVQPATTLTMSLNAAGVPTSANLAGGVNATVATLIADTTKSGSFNGQASTGEIVAIDTYAATYAARYSNFGEWRILPAVTVGTGPFTNGAFAGGMLLTPAASMPTSNVVVTGTYTGLMVGSAQDSVNNTPYSLNAGAVALSANFSTGALTGTLKNISVVNRATGAQAGYFNDLDLSATIGANAFTGSVIAQAGPGMSTCVSLCPPPTVGGPTASLVNLPVGTTGSSSGHFYGPNANELTGIWQLTSGTIQATGAFGADDGTSFFAISEAVNGTVALVAATLANVATPYRVVAVSGNDSTAASTAPFGGLVTDGAFNHANRVSADAAGNLTAFDGSFNSSNGSNTSAVLALGSAIVTDLGTDAVTGISWGRWQGGSFSKTDRATNVATTVANPGSLHWLAGPSMTAPVALPVTGTYNYVLAGGTLPTDNLGNVGTLNSATLTANFTTQTVNIGVNVGITNATGAANYVASANNVAIQQRSMFQANTGIAASLPNALTATCNGAGCGPVSAVQARIGGAFTGSTGQGAGMIYGFANGSNVVSGVAAFKR